MNHLKYLVPSALPTVAAALPILMTRPKTARFRSHSRKRELEKLESQILARIQYHRGEMTRLDFGVEHDWEDATDAVEQHTERLGRLQRTLSAVRSVLCS